MTKPAKVLRVAVLSLLKVQAQGHLYPLQLFQTEENVFPLDALAQMIKIVLNHICPQSGFCAGLTLKGGHGLLLQQVQYSM